MDACLIDEFVRGRPDSRRSRGFIRLVTEKRKAEAEKILSKYPDRIPVSRGGLMLPQACVGDGSED
jgi:hypothetical protein